MGGLASFLFEGKPPPSVETYGTQTQNLPQWMSDFQQGLIARANAIAAEPYQPYGGPRVAGFTPDTQNAFSMARQAANAYESPLTQALGLTQSALEPGKGALDTAAPYLQNASQTFPGAVQQYMDPYIGNVINRAQELANRNFTEQLMPAISGRFIRGGQYGSSAMQEAALRGARDVSENLQSQAAAQLSNAYTNAGQLFGADQARMAQLAQVAGGLGAQQQGAQLEGAQQLGALGQAAQQLGLTGASALGAIGQTQQDQNQRNLDLAYQDFVAQRDYPRTNADWMSSIIRGLPTPMTTQSTQTGPASTYQPSGISQLGSLLTGITGIVDIFRKPKPEEGKARGGRVRRRRRHAFTRGALARAYA